MDSNVMDIIITEYENQRALNERERRERIRKVYNLVPEIEQIDRQISLIGSATLRKILANPYDTEAKDEMHTKFAVLKQRKKELLTKFNLPLDYDQIRYKCPLCKDTGSVEGQGRCSCFKQKMIDNLYEKSNMKELLKKQNFSLFKDEFYSKKPLQGFKDTPYENIKKIKKFCIDFIENFDDLSKSLLFYGDTGLGKTYMSSCIGKELIDRGKTVLYMRASRLFRLFEDERFGRLEEDIDGFYKSDLLIIDDLGTEAFSKNNASFIVDLINERIYNDKKIIINTNLNFEGLEKLYTKRFSSRLLDSFDMIYFYGEDIRKFKLFNK